MRQTPILGCIADDFTGASDLASFLVTGGMSTLQTSGIPSQPLQAPAEALVVALKTRTCSVDQAIDQSLKAIEWLQLQGCHKFYFKYCSTFDSTKSGNIGPVIDALLERLKLDHALVCPALPQNGRTVYQGHLFVGNQLLEDSPLRNHPLTPMTESSLVDLLRPQVAQDHKDDIQIAPITKPETANVEHAARYLIVDAITPSDLKRIALQFGPDDRWLLTGGSGLGEWLGATIGREAACQSGNLNPTLPAAAEPSILCLAGSCSASTLRQVECASQIMPTLYLKPDDILNNLFSVDDARDWLIRQKSRSVLVTTSAPPEQVQCLQSQYGREVVSNTMESFLANLATTPGYSTLIVAGGETSGAVVQALGCEQLRVGKSVCPGVPILQEIGGNLRQLVLKSGNFGGDDFFKQACDKVIE